jgi:hypothetical protein
MTAPAPSPKLKRPRSQGHIHLPSVHVRKDGNGYDYDEDIYLGRNRPKRIVRFVAIAGDQPQLIRQTYDVLCEDELTALLAKLESLMDEHDPETIIYMRDRGEREFRRQQAIAAGEETACVWATKALCSRCL